MDKDFLRNYSPGQISGGGVGKDGQDRETKEVKPGTISGQVPALTCPWESCGIEVMPQTLPQLWAKNWAFMLGTSQSLTKGPQGAYKFLGTSF